MDESEDRKVFDSSLGGDVELPDDVNILKFAAARSKEISVMTECILEPCRTKLVFQSLPVHMRRRVMSHATNRLPRRVRIAHNAQQNKSGVPVSRKRRRRLKNLLDRTAHRRLKNRWLETHIWHAKRFHMVKRWGYSLPEAPCDKAFRACYRASSSHCLLQDISYNKCLEIAGDFDYLSNGFKRITSPKLGLTILANCYLNGQREGQCFIYNIDKYPYECLGKVMFMWKPDSNTNKRIWIFAHPSFYNNLIDLFKILFNLNLDEIDVPINEKRLKLNNGKAKNVSSNIFINNKYINKLNNITMIELNDTINRFRLTGPLSHSILVEVLKIIDTNNANNWFDSYIKNDNNLKTHSIQKEYWSKIETIKSPSDLRRYLIIGLNVQDPRLGLPSKRMKAIPKSGDKPSLKDLIDIPDTLCYSNIWDESIRKVVYDNKISTFEINKRRSETNLVPGESCGSFSDVPGIPILLLQRPGSTNSKYKRLGYNSGWDVIVPGGYGMAFWLSFILRGARTGGLRETSKLAFESGIHDVHPDTDAGKAEELRVKNMLLDKYFRLPPKKRVNLIKIAIKSPFHCPWNDLIKNWNNNQDFNNFFVLRDKKLLEDLQNMILTKKINSSIDWNQNCLVPVRLLSEGKGKITNFALICLPSQNDELSMDSEDLVEPLRKDTNKKERCSLRSNHKIILKRLRRQAVRKRRKILEAAKKYVNVPKQNNASLNEDYALRMRELWLPSDTSDVRNQCSKEVMGYVTKGEFSFTEAKGSGIGYITLYSLKALLEKNQFGSSKKCLVLTRNNLSRQYRFASMEIICEI